MGGEKPIAAKRWIAPLTAQAFSVEPEPFLTLRNGRRIGELATPGGTDNLVHDARRALSRLHMLWACSGQEYQATLQLWSSLAPTDQLTGAELAPLAKAIRKALFPSLAAEVANAWLPVDIAPGGTVGLQGTDDAGLDQVRRALGALGRRQEITIDGVRTPFEGVPSEQVNARDRWATVGAIRELKRAIASGTLGWAPIRADEDAASVDRFCGRTFSGYPAVFGKSSAFVPTKARPGGCAVHVFFSPGGATEGTGHNAVLMHGIRGAFAQSDWVVIGVPGYGGNSEKEAKAFPNFITTAQILTILKEIWRTDCTIERLSLSAHSRGVNALMYTLGGSPVSGQAGTGNPTIDASKVVKVTVFDDCSPELGVTMKKVGLGGKTQVLLATEEVNTSGLPAVDLRSPKLAASDPLRAKECWRAIGYVRFIDDALRMGRMVPPPDRLALVNLLVNGSPPWKERLRASVSELQSLCLAHTENGDMAKILDPKTGLREFVYASHLVRLDGDRLAPNIDNHHFHVAEVAHLAVP